MYHSSTAFLDFIPIEWLRILFFHWRDDVRGENHLLQPAEGVCLLVEGRGSRVTSRGSRVTSRGSRVNGRGSKNYSKLFSNYF